MIAAVTAKLQIWLRRRPLTPLIYIVCALIIVSSLVRWEPRTHDVVVNKAVGGLRKQLPSWQYAPWRGGTRQGVQEEQGDASGHAIGLVGAGRDPLTGQIIGSKGGTENVGDAKKDSTKDEAALSDADLARIAAAFPLDEGTPSCPEPPRPLIPSTSLGVEADLVYSSVGRLCLGSYLDELDRFVVSAFPQRDSLLSDPNSIRSRLHRYLNETLVTRFAKAKRHQAEPIPKTIHQTNRERGWRPDLRDQTWEPGSWVSRNEGWRYEQMTDEEADAWVKKHFTGEIAAGKKKAKGKSRLDEPGMTKVLDAWRRMRPTPVMRSDVWRYLKLAREGGVYSDMDTECLKPIPMWSYWEGRPAGGDGPFAGGEERDPPSVIIGIEADVGDRHDWHRWWPRPIQLAQWTMAASPSHPIFIDTLRRILNALDATPANAKEFEALFEEDTDLISTKRIMSVVELTGPGPFTDSVLRYLGVMTEGRIRWTDLRNLPMGGLRVGDVLIEQITAFSPGIGHQGAEEPTHPGAYVKHGFAGTWKAGLQQ